MTSKFKKGDRVTFSKRAFGRDGVVSKFWKDKCKTGLGTVACNPKRELIYVKWDGYKPGCMYRYHEAFIEKVKE